MLYFSGHLNNALHFMQLREYVPHMLSKSRFCRLRLHWLADFILTLFYAISKQSKDMVDAADNRLDFFPSGSM